ncbi:MAG: VWA domain-containing protein [Phycisphaeraceae bacterium]|nr:VWA domain-containing protein [Phycisphaeraceae bacterium]
MWFVNPAMWWWALALVVPVVLYLVRHKPVRQRVTTLLFFKSLAKEHQEAAWLRRLKRILSLLLTLLVLAALVGALTRPVIAPPSEGVRSLVIVVDRSASMAARDEAGSTMLDLAIASIERRLSALPAGTPVSLITYDTRPRILLARSFNRRALLWELRALGARPIQGHAAPALRLAQRLASVETPANVWHFSDAPPVTVTDEVALDQADAEPPAADALAALGEDALQVPGEEDDGLDIEVEHFYVATEQLSNVGLTGFALRRVPMDPSKFEAFVQVHASGTSPTEVELNLLLGGELAGLLKFDLEPGTLQRVMVPVEASEDQTVTLRVKSEGDALSLDDEVAAWIPTLDPLRVLWVAPRPDSFTELALRVLGNATQVEVFHTPPDAFPPKEPFDVVIFQGWLPERWPEDTPAIVIDPPYSSGPVRVTRLERGGLPLESVRATDPGHPLLYRVATPRVAVMQTVSLEADAASAGLQPLWRGPAGAVLAAGDIRGQRIVVMGFAPERSETLPLTAAYPLLVGNAVYWCTQSRRQEQVGNLQHTGTLIQLDSEPLNWQTTRGDEAQADAVGSWIELDRVGLWSTAGGKRGSAALLDAEETLLGFASTGADVTGKGGGIGGWLSGDLTELLLLMALAVLLLESYLFHRRSVY